MSVVDKLLVVFNALGKDDKLLFMSQVSQVDVHDGKTLPHATGKQVLHTFNDTPRTKRRGYGKKAHFWMRHITGYDASKRGIMALEGDWIKSGDVAGLPEGSFVVIGTRETDDEPKKYMIATQTGWHKGVDVGKTNVPELEAHPYGWVTSWPVVAGFARTFLEDGYVALPNS